MVIDDGETGFAISNNGGPTREYLDPVRFLTNGSTGKMGYACAAAAIKRGHKVTLISGPVGLARPKGVKLVRVVSSEEMAEAVGEHFNKCDCVIMTAAVCDYRPAKRWTHKMEKSPGGMNLELERTRDILAELGQDKKDKMLIGFAVQDKGARKRAKQKLVNKNLDAIILNGPAAFAANRTDVSILQRGEGWVDYPIILKSKLGGLIVRLAEDELL